MPRTEVRTCVGIIFHRVLFQPHNDEVIMGFQNNRKRKIFQIHNKVMLKNRASCYKRPYSKLLVPRTEVRTCVGLKHKQGFIPTP